MNKSMHIAQICVYTKNIHQANNKNNIDSATVAIAARNDKEKKQLEHSRNNKITKK